MVITDVLGCYDTIEPGVSGILVPVRNAQSLAYAIEGLLNNLRNVVRWAQLDGYWQNRNSMLIKLLIMTCCISHRVYSVSLIIKNIYK